MYDALELELRQLPGVLFVAFAEGGGTTYIEIVAVPLAEHSRVRDEAARAAVNHLEGPAEIGSWPPRTTRLPFSRATGWGSL